MRPTSWPRMFVPLSSGVGVSVGAGLRQRAERAVLRERGRRPGRAAARQSRRRRCGAWRWRRYYAGAPVSAHRRPAKRTPSVSRRTANSAPQPGPHALDAPVLAQREQRQRDVDGRRGEHAPHQVAGVGGADEDPVEREHRAGRRHQRREQRPHRVRALDHRVVGGEGVRQHVREREQHAREHRARPRPTSRSSAPPRRARRRGRRRRASARPSPARRSRSRRARARGR